MNALFPRKSTLWMGAIFGGIVNATMTAESVGYSAFQQWVRNSYVLNGGDGREGVVTFAGGHWYADAPLVGVFHDAHSARFYTDDEMEREQFFQGCPPYQRALADQGALPYLELEFEGKLLHRVTAAFWDEGEYLAAADPWEVLLKHGISLINNEVIENKEALFAKFQTSYGMSAEQVAFARSLFERKLARPPALIELTPAETRFLASTFEDPKIRDAELEGLMGRDETAAPAGQDEAAATVSQGGRSIDAAAEARKAMHLCRELFAEIGIIVPARPKE
jgi:hypothetical protein